MNVLVLGSGGREHTIAYKLSLSNLVDRLFWAPGNGAVDEIAENPEIKLDDFDRIVSFVKQNKIDLTVVGPEAPLVAGISNRFKQEGLNIFGPDSNGAMIEGSKIFAKKLMRDTGIPTADFMEFYNYENSRRYIEKLDPPYVIKADGLAAGKGVVIANDKKSAEKALTDMFKNKIFGESGSRIVIEQFLDGEEATVLALCDGNNIVPLISSQDHKAAYDGDNGPNTGGMGAIAPAPVVNSNVMEKVVSKILKPLVKAFQSKGIEYRGVIYAGLMIIDENPHVVEFNCRFGDPEIEAVLPLMESDITELLYSTAIGDLSNISIKWKDEYCCDVVLCSGGYPGKYEKGKKIFGLENLKGKDDAFVFQAGTKREDNKLLTNGGRVLNITAIDDSLQSAIDKAYSYVSVVNFEGMYYRKDIGYRGLKHL